MRVDARWGWTCWEVDAEDGRALIEIAVIRPGTGRKNRTLLMANSDNAGRLRLLGGIGGTVVGAVGGLAGFAATSPALLIAGTGGAAGVGAGMWVRRRWNRWLGDAVRFQDDDAILSRLPAARAARSMNLINFKIGDFHQHMDAVARQHGTEPVPLPLDQTIDYLLDEIHQAVWDLASGQTANTDGEVLVELWRVSKAVDDAINAAWSTWHASQVVIPPPPVVPEPAPLPATPAETPPDPALQRPTVDRLSRLTGSVRDAHTATSQAAQDVREINQRDLGR
ncbi:hypothetical protein H4P1_00014 (plasmid) [Variovorax sp. PBS-H4]|nr:hypothetical protein H4P1_00014 [Variovorax sp. PBS-H4]